MTARTIDTEPLRVTIGGRDAIIDIPVIPPDAGPTLHEGLRRRRVAAHLGWCPCGARRLADRDEGNGVSWTPIPHKLTCQANDGVLGPEIELWQQQDGGHRRGAQTR